MCEFLEVFLNTFIRFLLTVGIGALIGWVTNYLAIRLLFRPYKEINLIFFKLHGLIPKRRHEIAINIADVIENELISMKEIGNKYSDSVDYTELDDFIDKLVEEKIKGELLDKNPILKMMASDTIMQKIKKYMKNLILENKEEMLEMLIRSIEKNVDLKAHIIEKMDNFSLHEIEDIIMQISKNELRHIEILGGILGAVIAVFQFLILNIKW